MKHTKKRDSDKHDAYCNKLPNFAHVQQKSLGKPVFWEAEDLLPFQTCVRSRKGRSPTCSYHQTHHVPLLLHPGHKSNLIYIASADGKGCCMINNTCFAKVALSFLVPLLVHQNACSSQSPQEMLLPFAVKESQQLNDLSVLPNSDARMVDMAKGEEFLDSYPLSEHSFVSSFNRPSVLATLGKQNSPLNALTFCAFRQTKQPPRDRLYIVPIVVNA